MKKSPLLMVMHVPLEEGTRSDERWDNNMNINQLTSGDMCVHHQQEGHWEESQRQLLMPSLCVKLLDMISSHYNFGFVFFFFVMYYFIFSCSSLLSFYIYYPGRDCRGGPK